MAWTTQRQWQQFDELIRTGHKVKEAARACGISENTAYMHRSRQKKENRAVEIPLQAQTVRIHKGEKVVKESGGPEPVEYEDLCEEAKRALEDFSYFQRRYIGRIATPWQKEAADMVVEWLRSPHKEFVVINAPPGCGKSTTFCLDICAWLTCRNRAIRGQIGSKIQKSAEKYVIRLRNLLSMTIPYEPASEDIQKGLAARAEATIAGDFGTFKPDDGQWSAEGFFVAQLGGQVPTEKEPTWSAFGMDSGFLGMRYDIIIWDDLVDKTALRSTDAKEKMEGWWDDIAEKRLEPSGVLILQGQRMGGDDLYRYALNKRVELDADDDLEDDEDLPDSPNKYAHIVFKAHYDDRCEGLHKRTSPYYPEGCLLDPRRLTWRDLRMEMGNPRNNFAVIYQQEDVDPSNVLVDKLWIEGGIDAKTRVSYPGCLDRERGIGELPHGLYGTLLSIATADPSPTKFWAIEWWVVRVVDGVPQERYLMDLIRQKMDAPSFLDWNNPTQSFSGVMEDWQHRSVDLKLPITTWIVEKNGAQNFMLQYEHVRRWCAQWRVQLVPHNTHNNKADSELGIQTLAGVYKWGLARLPYRRGDAFQASAKLIEELTHHPDWKTDDTVMANWFLEFNLPRLIPASKPLPRLNRPSWLKHADTFRRRLPVA